MRQAQHSKIKSQKLGKISKKSVQFFLAISTILLISHFSFLFSSADAVTGINKQINFQGKLTNTDGTNVANNTYSVVFTLYDAASGGTNLWDETQNVTTVDGIFQVALGSVDTTLGNVNFNSDQLYLGIKVGSDSEMTPRIRFTAVPYAFNAHSLNGVVATQSASGFTLTGGTSTSKVLGVNNSLTFAGTDGTTITFQGSDTYVGQTTTDILTNKTIGSTGLTFSGATTDITTATNETFTITPNGTGDLVFTSDQDTTFLIGSASNTPAVLSISGGIGNNAALIVNQTNSGDLFVASASGTTKFVISNVGAITSANYTTNTGVLYTDSNGLFQQTGAGSDTDCLIMSGTTPMWGSCISGGGSDMSQATTTVVATTIANSATVLGTVSITPTNTTGDVWVQANFWTRSLNSTDQTITWELRSGVNCSGTLLTSQTSLLNSASGANGPSVYLTYLVTNPGTSALNYTACASSTTNNGVSAEGVVAATVIDNVGPQGPAGETLWQLPGNGTITPLNLTTDVLFGATSTGSAKFAFINILSGTPTASISAGAAGGVYLSATGTLSTTNRQTLSIGNAVSGNILINPMGTSPVGVGFTGTPLAGLDIRGVSGILPVSSVSGTTSFAGLLVNNSGVGDLFTASSSGVSQFVIRNGGQVGIGTTLPTAMLDVAGTASLSSALTFRANGGGTIQTTNNQTLTLGGATTGNIALLPLQHVSVKPSANTTATFRIQNAAGTTLFNADTTNSRIGIGTETPVSTFDVRGTLGTLPVASISGLTSFASLIVDNAGVGDLFTASKSGVSTFTVTNSGQITSSNYQVAGGLLYTTSGGLFLQTTAGGTGQCLQSTGGGAPTWGSCGTGGTNVGWNIANGAITPNITTTDLLLGGIATDSAKFAVINVNSGTPTATLSATATGYALSLTADGVITTTQKQTLTLGGGSTGEVYAASLLRLDPTAGIIGGGLSDCDNPATAKLLWDASNNRFSCGTDQGGGEGSSMTVRESDSSPAVSAVAVLEFGPGSVSADEFIVTDEGSGIARVRIGNQVGLLNQAETVTGGWTFNTASTIFTTALSANGGINTSTTDTNLTLAANGAGHMIFSVDGDSFVGLGTTSPLATLDVRGQVGTSPAASISALTSFAGLVADNKGSGDIFTASQGGRTRFTITPTGNIQFTGNTNFLTTLTSAATSVYTLTLPNAGGNDSLCLLSLDNCSTWDIMNGTMQSKLTGTLDLLIGGTSTASAKFGFLNVNSGTPTASISAGSSVSGATYMTGTGILQTTNMQSLTLGSATTGNIILNPTGGSSVGINTASPLASVDIRSASGQNGGTVAIASISGNTAFAGLVINNWGSGDILAASTGGAIALVVKNNGNVGIGTDSPDEKLHVDGNIFIDQATDSTQADEQNWTLESHTTPGTMVNGATGSIASMSASTVYNGSLYIGTSKTNEAEVYRYNGSSGNWTKVSQSTAGTIASGGTANIDTVSSMIVYNGKLYIGTTDVQGAEVYEYQGGTTWAKISQASAGQIAASGTTAIYGISSMIVYSGRLLIGTEKVGGAQLYRWDGGTSWTLTNTTLGQFVTTNSVAQNKVSAMGVLNGTLYVAVAKPNGADLLRYNGNTGASVFTKMNNNTSGSFTVNGVNNTTIDEITSMTVYNGRLYIGISEPNEADVWAYDGNTQNTTVNTFHRISNVAGQIDSNSSQNIDTVSSMTVYNGRLYVATQESNAAEAYRYEGVRQWIRVSQGTPGTLAAGGTANIDGISQLQQYGGSLWAGTFDPGSAEMYSYTFVKDQSYSLVFHAGTQAAGGEQNDLLNTGRIFFMASPSANMQSIGRQGAFYFTQGIQTQAGAYDVAEDYPTRDDQLTSGDVVVLDPNEKGLVRRSQASYDSTVIGIYSENPGFRLSQQGETIDGLPAIPVALAGRVPVKVSTENGAISPGDFLTSSSTPGVAMKATKPGFVFGQAMNGYSSEGIGSVLVFIKNQWYDPDTTLVGLNNFELKHATDSATFALVGNTGEIVTRVGVFAEAAIGNIQVGYAEAQSMVITTSLNVRENIITGALTAGDVTAESLEVTTENVSIGGLTLRSYITAVVQDVLRSEAEKKEHALTDAVPGLLTQESGEALFKELLAENVLSATVSATVIASGSEAIPGEFEIASSSATSRNDELSLDSLNVEGLATISSTLRVKNNGLIEGVLTVVDTLMTKNIVISGLATFFDNVVFKGDVLFAKTPTFSKDTAGFAVIKKGADRVEIVFDKPYEQLPVVNASLSLEELEKKTNETEEKKDQRQHEFEEAVLGSNIDFIITKRTPKGFMILLNESAEENLTFSWTALAVDEIQTFESHEITQSIQTPTDIVPSPSPAGGGVPDGTSLREAGSTLPGNLDRGEVIEHEGTH